LNLQVSHETLEKGIVKYMLAEKQDLSDVKTIERFIEETQFFLHSSNCEDGNE
jgi:hypothetical protein